VRVLIVGSGGREHALGWKLAQSPHVTEIVSAPGSPGLQKVGECVPVAADDVHGLAKLAEARKADLTVVGPEAPLVAGIVDEFRARGLRVFGPTKAAAEIEASKVFCRGLATRHGIPMAQGQSFDDPEAAADCARTLPAPLVVKADGLAAGKGVLICATQAEAVGVIDRMMREDMFGSSGRRVVVEEFLEGRETSMLCLTDGATKLFFEPAQDYKRANDRDEGLNTGGMGAYSPVPWLLEDQWNRARSEIAEPLMDAMAAEGRPFTGCFYTGLMFTAKGPRLIEVNCRFGDPEIEALVLRLDSDLFELLDATVDGTLASHTLDWRDAAAVSVVVASGGYPEQYETGKRIDGIDEAEATGDVVVFHAGTARRDGVLVSAGGRVLNVAARGDDIAAARKVAYEAVAKIEMDGMHHRSDIADLA
jgi:phosphoribosylamine--glycine ligase